MGLDSGLLFPMPVVIVPSNLSSTQDFINIIKFVDFKVSSHLSFLFHSSGGLCIRLNGSFMGGGTGEPQTLSSSSHHRVHLTDSSHCLSSHT